MSTPEIEHRLGTIRRIANSARNGHPESIIKLANEILILDAQIANGAELPEAWQVEPTAPELPKLPIPAFDAVDDGDEVRCPHKDEETGEVCGRPMEVAERVWDYRPTHWRHEDDGRLTFVIGDGQYGDGQHDSFACDAGHEFDLPDYEMIEYGF